MCAIHRAGGNAPMNQAHSMEGFSDDNGAWGYFEEEEHEGQDQEPEQQQNERARQQQERAEIFKETGARPEIAVVEQGGHLLHELLQQVRIEKRPHQPAPTGTERLAAMSESSTYKSDSVRFIDRSRRLIPEPALQLRPETFLPPQPMSPDELPSILTPPPASPSQRVQPDTDAPTAPLPSSPWAEPTAPPHPEAEELPPPQPIPDSPFDPIFGRDPYSALKKLKPSKNPEYNEAPEAFWPDQQAPTPASLPHFINPQEAQTPPPQTHQPAIRFLSTPRTKKKAPAPAIATPPPPPHEEDDLEATIGGANSLLLVDDDFFERMAAQSPPSPTTSPQRSQHVLPPKIDLEEALGAFDLAAIDTGSLIDIGLVGQDVDGDTMFAGDADALLREAAAELADNGWLDDPFDPGFLSLDHMPLNDQSVHQDLEDDHIDSTMMGAIDDIKDLHFDGDWDDQSK